MRLCSLPRRALWTKSDEGIQKASSDLCQTLLSSEQTYPQDSLFRDDLFDTTCRKIRNRNEAMVIRDISPLIVPSAQTLATYCSIHLNLLIESANECWNSASPFTALAHSLIIPWGSDNPRLQMINSKSSSRSLARFQIVLRLVS
jgi:hypothetical protein